MVQLRTTNSAASPTKSPAFYWLIIISKRHAELFIFHLFNSFRLLSDLCCGPIFHKNNLFYLFKNLILGIVMRMEGRVNCNNMTQKVEGGVLGLWA